MKIQPRFQYEGERTRTISFPLGGLGTGSLGLAGNGALVDWDIFNRPSKGSHNGFSHFAVSVIDGEQTIDARVLNGDHEGPYEGQHGSENFYSGFGWGPHRETMVGMPHFRDTRFTGTFPIAQLEFLDSDFPGAITLTAFNPFIPYDDRASGMPAAFFEFQVTNSTHRPLSYQFSCALTNPFPVDPVNHFTESEGISSLVLAGEGTSLEGSGQLCVAVESGSVSYQEHWYEGGWFDELEVYWRDLGDPAGFRNRRHPEKKNASTMTGVLATRIECLPGETKTVRFVLGWYIPQCRRFWDRQPLGPGETFTDEEKLAMAKPWKNWYSVVWPSVTAVVQEALDRWDTLWQRTKEFRDVLFSSSLPDSSLDAVSATLSVLKSATVLRLEDGSFYGWEGAGAKLGSCEGTCTHVWSYAQSLAFLFPHLEQGMRSVEYRYNLGPEGGMSFRTMLPLGSPAWRFRACVDGQFGTVLRVYREWKVMGNREWLTSIWPAVKSSVAFAWHPGNPDAWDPDRSGVIVGRQHHTLDMELFGPNSWLTGMYLAGLKASAELATILGDSTFAAECQEVFQRGKVRLDTELFNGSYYGQVLDLTSPSTIAAYDSDVGDMFGNSLLKSYWSQEHRQIKYQVGGGLLIDHALAQWHAGLYGLGEIFDPDQLRVSLKALWTNNRKRSMRREANPCRVFSLNDEEGMVICTWPEGSQRPGIPIPYAQETMTGFEYAAAALLVQSSMVDEGLSLVEAIRSRYDGKKRNPWNELECGSNYARALSAYSVLLAVSGFVFDADRGILGFRPAIEKPWSFFWSALGGWGSATMTENRFDLVLKGGSIALEQLVLPELTAGMDLLVKVDEEPVPIKVDTGGIQLGSKVVVHHKIEVEFSRSF